MHQRDPLALGWRRGPAWRIWRRPAPGASGTGARRATSALGDAASDLERGGVWDEISKNRMDAVTGEDVYRDCRHGVTSCVRTRRRRHGWRRTGRGAATSDLGSQLGLAGLVTLGHLGCQRINAQRPRVTRALLAYFFLYTGMLLAM